MKRPDGEIRFEVHGEGYPVLLFAPGGLRSRMEMWPAPAEGPPRPWVDWTKALPEAGFRAIAMDQRNAGGSRADIRADHGWHTYAADHLALMDHLGCETFHVLGGCIGGSYCLKAAATAPRRVTAAVLQNPIGLHPTQRDYFPNSHPRMEPGAKGSAPGAEEAAVAAFGRNMWNHDFVFSVDRAFARTCPVPTFLLPGSDVPHPAETSAELAALLPGVKVLASWRGPEHLRQQEAGVVAFLREHTPA